MILCVNIYSFRYLHYIYIYLSGNSYSMFEALQSVQAPGGAIQSGGRSEITTWCSACSVGRPHFDRRHHLAKMPSWRAHLIGYLHLSAPKHRAVCWSFTARKFQVYLDFQGTAVRVTGPKRFTKDCGFQNCLEISDAFVSTEARKSEAGEWQQIRTPCRIANWDWC